MYIVKIVRVTRHIVTYLLLALQTQCVKNYMIFKVARQATKSELWRFLCGLMS